MNILTASTKDIDRALVEGNLKACVIGLSYVGLPLCVILAEKGFLVTGIDKNKGIIKKCREGQAGFHEKGLDRRLARLVQRRVVDFSQDIYSGTRSSSLVFITVGSPLTQDGVMDSSSVKEVVTAVGSGLTRGKLVIIKSTLYVGGTRKIVKPLLEEVSGLAAERDFGLAFVPERTVEGKSLKELSTLPKIIAGVGPKSRQAAQNMLGLIGGPLVPVSSLEVAEAAKLFDNIYRDVNIALANELAIRCEQLGIDVIETINAANHRYHRTNILFPGVGVGGSCLTKDPYIFTQTSMSRNGHNSIILQSRKINDSMPEHFMELIRDAFQGMGKVLAGSNIAVLGYAMKGNTSDIRNTPAKKLVKLLMKEKALVRLYDPYVNPDAVREDAGICTSASIEETVNGSDAICIVTDHEVFHQLDLNKLRDRSNNPSALIDGRHVINPKAAMSLGFVFRGVGRPV